MALDKGSRMSAWILARGGWWGREALEQSRDLVTESGGNVGELGKFRVVGALGRAGEEARCEMWYESGKMMGAQSGALGPPGTLVS